MQSLSDPVQLIRKQCSNRGTVRQWIQDRRFNPAVHDATIDTRLPVSSMYCREFGRRHLRPPDIINHLTVTPGSDRFMIPRRHPRAANVTRQAYFRLKMRTFAVKLPKRSHLLTEVQYSTVAVWYVFVADKTVTRIVDRHLHRRRLLIEVYGSASVPCRDVVVTPAHADSTPSL